MSDYLDNMRIAAGRDVVCVANLCCPNFTVGKVYTVQNGKQLIDDTGTLCLPSARFKRHYKSMERTG